MEQNAIVAKSVIDYEDLRRRFADNMDGEGRLLPGLDDASLDRFALVAFVRPARQILRVASPRFGRRDIEFWMAYLNDQDPNWRLRQTTRRFCRTRRREFLVESCIREDYELFLRARGFGKAFAAWKKTQVERLRHAKRIVRILAMRMQESGARKESRDCLFVIRRLSLGGLERAQVSLANAVASLGRTVDILNLGGIDPTLKADLDPRVQLVDTRTALRRSYFAGVNYSNWHFPEIVTRGIEAKRRIQWVHSDLLWIFDRFPRNKWANEYRHMDKVVCVSHHSRQGFVSLYPFSKGRAETIYSFYDMNPVLERAKEEPALRFPRDLPVAITVARLADPKGLERAVRVHARLAEKGIDFRWYVVGDGTMRKRVESLISAFGLETRFILLGEIANPFPLMSQADVFVLPSFHEGFGLATLEAMTLRLPILLADFGAARECVWDGHNGLVAKSNTRCIAEGLESMLTDPAKRDKFRENLRDFRWDNETILKQVEKALFL